MIIWSYFCHSNFKSIKIPWNCKSFLSWITKLLKCSAMRYWLIEWSADEFNSIPFNTYVNCLIDHFVSRSVTLHRHQCKSEHAMTRQKGKEKRDGMTVADRRYTNIQGNHQQGVLSTTVHRHHDTTFHRTTQLHETGMWMIVVINIDQRCWKLLIFQILLLPLQPITS